MSAKRWAGAAVLFAAILSGGCETMTGTGALAGGAVGTGVGAALGGGKGAVVGGLLGAVTGGAIGNNMDREERHEQDHRLAVAEARAAAAPSGPAVGMSEVIQMTREGMTEGVIIRQIRSTNSTFQLSVEDLRTLQANNVAPRVIEEMQMRRPVTRVVQPRYIYQQPPTVIYEPYPPPRPYWYYR